jgi:Flp pilus assembly protein TadG
MFSWRTNRQRSEEGASAVELALVLPILVILLVGIVQFAFIFDQWLQIEHAAREGVRWASLVNPAPDVIQHTISAAPGLNPAITSGDITLTPGDPTTAMPGTTATVVVRRAVPVFVPMMDVFLGDSVALEASASQLLEK